MRCVVPTTTRRLGSNVDTRRSPALSISHTGGHAANAYADDPLSDTSGLPSMTCSCRWMPVQTLSLTARRSSRKRSAGVGSGSLKICWSEAPISSGVPAAGTPGPAREKVAALGGNLFVGRVHSRHRAHPYPADHGKTDRDTRSRNDRSCGFNARSGRTSSMLKRQVPACAPHLTVFGTGAGGLLFPNRKGAGWRRGSFNDRVWKPALRRAGPPSGFGIHAGRHTYASALIADTRTR